MNARAGLLTWMNWTCCPNYSMSLFSLTMMSFLSLNLMTSWSRCRIPNLHCCLTSHRLYRRCRHRLSASTGL